MKLTKKKNKKSRVEIDGKWFRITPTGRIGVELTHNGHTMTESEFFGRIRSALRQATKFWVPALQALEQASTPYTGIDKRIKKVYACSICQVVGSRTTVHVDHIIACGSLKTFDDVGDFCRRAFAESATDYQVLCKPCNYKKGKSK